MVDKELIGIWRNMLKPSISSWLLKTNYEGMGEQDKEEFERDFDEILDLALIGLKYKAQLSQEGTTKDTTSDTINRQQAIDAIMGEYPDAHYPDWYASKIRALPSAQPEQRWVPCSETVDIPDHEVMTCDRYGAFIIGYLDCKDEQWICESDDSIMYDPVAWCELPKPYKEGGADE